MIDEIIQNALREDLGDGDHSTLSCVPENATGVAKLLVKGEGIMAGIELAKRIFELYDPALNVTAFINDGDPIQYGDIAFEVKGSSRSILSTERLVLNFMQRMSGIASKTKIMCDLIKSNNTNKTTPGIRYIEKWAVRIGGGYNHRFALYDMIMLKDNHVDYAGGVKPAIERANAYLKETGRGLKIEIEVRNEIELAEVIALGNVDRIMLDNFTPEKIVAVLKTVPDHFEVEASGGITIDTIRSYAETGVDFISVGSLTHSFVSLDMSLKAKFN